MQTTLSNKEYTEAKPFLKWAGGKSQLLPEFNLRMPMEILKSKVIESYVEPFVGGGAMFFFLKREYDIKESFLFDINKELLIGYEVIKKDYEKLIDNLKAIEKKFLSQSEEQRKEFFYEMRDEYNKQMLVFDYENYSEDWIKRAEFLIFLNKTCFNGLFRQNKKGEFNVPFGRYKKPKICDEKNIKEVNKALKDTLIFRDDFAKAAEYVKSGSFVYLDPPYRPISKTSSFTNYAKDGFTDDDQRRLALFFREMDKRGAFLMLSNSDPKNIDPDDNFFDDLYEGFNIERVPAKRFINCDASKRGEINEIIVRNY